MTTEDATSLAFAAIDEVAEAAIAAGKLPGCVVLVGRRDEVLFRRAYGAKALLPERVPMTLDTVFDVASLTKAVATTTSLMRLVERGAVDLDKPASTFIPEIARLPRFTVRHLLLHTSGLPATTTLSEYGSDRQHLLEHIGRLPKVGRPGEHFVYSDVGFVLLEEIVRRASGEDLATFAAKEIFAPLGMRETTFLPGPELGASRTDGAARRPLDGRRRARSARVCAGRRRRARRALLDRRGHGALRAGAPRRSEARVTRDTRHVLRALPDLEGGPRPRVGRRQHVRLAQEPALLRARVRARRLHRDRDVGRPRANLFVVFLSNRVHPDGKGAVHPLVADIGTRAVRASDEVTGVDVLADEGFAALRGAKVALLTNTSARSVSGARTLDVLRKAPESSSSSASSPRSTGSPRRRRARSATRTWEGVPVSSLYGARTTPPPASSPARHARRRPPGRGRALLHVRVRR